MNRPKVSVSLITYNHEKYIEACLDSIVRQITGFKFEIVVCDDCSTDSTPEIISAYALKYPGLIRPVLRKANIGMVQNALASIKACTGEYIALMEGDDYWTDDHKLQMQAGFLDKNPDCAFCFTNAYMFFEDVPGKNQLFCAEENTPPEKCDLRFFIGTNIIVPNNTKMFRSEVQPGSFPDFMYYSINWDWVLHVLQAQKGKIGYINAVTLAYRRHGNAAFAVKDEADVLLDGIATVKALNKYLDYKYAGIMERFWWEYHELAFIYLRRRHFIRFFIYYIKYLAALRKGGKFNFRDELWCIKQSLSGKKI